jgi:hypothetical protein
MKIDASPRAELRVATLVVAGQELLVFREPIAAPASSEHGLSTAEEEAIVLLLEGLSLEEVARRRSSRVAEVVRDVDSACRKLGVPGRRTERRPARDASSRRLAS